MAKRIPAGLTAAMAALAVGAPMLGSAGAALAQSHGSIGAAQFQAGYQGARYTTARPSTGSTRDINGNRLIVNGIIQSGASAYSQATGAASSYAGAGGGSGLGVAGSTAIGNNLNVVVQGNWNTVIVNSTQTNTGDITAGTALNGTLDLND